MRSFASPLVRSGFLLAVVVPVVLTPAILPAASITIWPNQLSVRYLGSPAEIVPTYASAAGGGSTPCFFTAPVSLPVGSTVTRLRYYYRHYGLKNTTVTLRRYTMGQPETDMAVVSFTGDNAAITAVTTNTIAFPVVTAGYRYYVDVTSSGNAAQIHGIKIFYRPPSPAGGPGVLQEDEPKP